MMVDGSDNSWPVFCVFTFVAGVSNPGGPRLLKEESRRFLNIKVLDSESIVKI
jgi:hypothetical protein